MAISLHHPHIQPERSHPISRMNVLDKLKGIFSRAEYPKNGKLKDRLIHTSVLNQCGLVLPQKVWLSLIISSGMIPVWMGPTHAQIIPDNTLPNPSIVPENCSDCPITGGTSVGTNLFHSFEEFSIPENGSALFDNASNIERIISRVTGLSESNINGLLQTNGVTDFFLINPNGIVFGENARLNVGGSFLATTADSLVFSEGVEFSAVNPDASLLTVNVPMGLQFGNSPGTIQVESATLQSAPEATLALLGGDIMLSGGQLSTRQGSVELGSVNKASLVSVMERDRSFSFDYDNVLTFGTIQLVSNAVIGAVGDQGGDINVFGGLVRLEEGSQIFSVASGTTGAGEVLIQGSEQIVLSRNSEAATGIFNEVEGEASGALSGFLQVRTPRLLLSGGSLISTTTFGAGQGVDLIIDANEIELDGTFQPELLDSTEPSGFFAFASEGDTGRGGRITIATDQLTLRNGAQISVSTFGTGNSGTLTINATERINVLGRSLDNAEVASGLFSSVERQAIGNGGNVTINTPQLTVRDGAQISTVARNTGEGGILRINASESIVLSGAETRLPDTVRTNRSGLFVSAEPGAASSGGTLRLTTPQLTIEDRARISADNFGTGEGGNVVIRVDELTVQNGGQLRAASFEDAGENAGPAGSIDIDAQTVEVSEGSEITVSSALTQSGNLTIQANEIRLVQGQLTAETQQTAPGETGANIELSGLELLFMTDGSLISARAFDDADGGNVTINASDGFITAPEEQDSDIIANAFEGRGGFIEITTQGIFGFEERRAVPGNGTNDIDASSEFGLFDGEVIIDSPDIDPNRGLTELPSTLVDASSLIAQGCNNTAIAQRPSEFIVTGRGGLPLTPDGQLEREWLLTVWSIPSEHLANTRAQSTPLQGALPPIIETIEPEPSTYPIIEAQGWSKQSDGRIDLIAYGDHSQLNLELSQTC